MKFFKNKKKNRYNVAPKIKKSDYPKINNTDIKHICKSIFGISICIAVLISVITGILYTYIYIIHSDFFNVTEVTINGTEYLDKNDIFSESRIKIGNNSLSVNISEVEQRLYQNPWVQDVSVKRILPDKFKITVQERKAEFWITHKGKMYYADLDGNIIAPIQSENFLSLPKLEFCNKNSTLQYSVSDLLYFLKNKKKPINSDMVSAIRISDEKGIEIIIGNDQLSVFLRLADLKTGFARLNKILDDLARRNELKYIEEIWICEDTAWVAKKKIE